MSDLIWWIGAVHVAAYVMLGTAMVTGWAIWKAHSFGKYNARMLQWHFARMRWAMRHDRGLTDDEWKRGEPRP